MLVGTHGHIYPSTVAGFQKVNECLLEKKSFGVNYWIFFLPAQVPLHVFY
jgi:hypothetical protein